MIRKLGGEWGVFYLHGSPLCGGSTGPTIEIVGGSQPRADLGWREGKNRAKVLRKERIWCGPRTEGRPAMARPSGPH